jgi:hypothetical protein
MHYVIKSKGLISMPSGRYTRIEITREAYMGLEAEAVLQGKTLKKLASEMILKNISPKALQFVNGGKQILYHEETADSNGETEKKINIRTHRPKISDNIEVIKQIKVLWSQSPRPSQREIAKIIHYPASSTKYQIKIMRVKGELKG